MQSLLIYIRNSVRWVTGPFLVMTLLLSIGGLAWYIPHYGVHPLEPVTCVFLVYLIAWAVSSGYHRYFAHKSYTSHPLLKIFFLIVGAASLEQSALIWASDHRNHHRFVDTDQDPYNIKKGFWWAHWGWLFAQDPASRAQLLENVPDLAKDKWVMWQHKYWVLLALGPTLVLPLLLGWWIGRPFGMLLWAGLLRVVLTHHTTFLINSAAHKFGTQPYSDESSAGDVWWMVPFLCGENYHNYHHRFQSDYRNGIKWYQYDPSKWLLWLLAHTPLVSNLRRAPESHILQARLEMDLKRLQGRLNNSPPEIWEPIYQRFLYMKVSVLESAEYYSKACQNYFELKKELWKKSGMSLQQAKASLEERRKALNTQLAAWRKNVSWACRAPHSLSFPSS